ncbi:Transient receptor putative cation channel sub M member 7, partial [Rhizoclosmatium hyalinum]
IAVAQGKNGADNMESLVDDLVFANGFIIKVESAGGAPEYWMGEELITGNFKKYQCNHEFGNVTGIAAKVMDCFSHYSWVVSEGKLLICDLQGNIESKLLTDPQIHTSNEPEIKEMYSCGDLSDEGIQIFFNQHKCSIYCEAISIDKNRLETYTDNDH